jgi:hypothetical protein
MCLLRGDLCVVLQCHLQLPGPGFVLAPHIYPPCITRNAKETTEEISRRWDLSWGLKLQGLDNTSQVTLYTILLIYVPGAMTNQCSNGKVSPAARSAALICWAAHMPHCSDPCWQAKAPSKGWCQLNAPRLPTGLSVCRACHYHDCQSSLVSLALVTMEMVPMPTQTQQATRLRTKCGWLRLLPTSGTCTPRQAYLSRGCSGLGMRTQVCSMWLQMWKGSWCVWAFGHPCIMTEFLGGPTLDVVWEAFHSSLAGVSTPYSVASQPTTRRYTCIWQ